MRVQVVLKNHGGGGRVHDRLRVVTRLDLVFGGEEGGGDEKGEQSHLGPEIGLGLGLERGCGG